MGEGRRGGRGGRLGEGQKDHLGDETSPDLVVFLWVHTEAPPHPSAGAEANYQTGLLFFP